MLNGLRLTDGVRRSPADAVRLTDDASSPEGTRWLVGIAVNASAAGSYLAPTHVTTATSGTARRAPSSARRLLRLIRARPGRGWNAREVPSKCTFVRNVFACLGARVRRRPGEQFTRVLGYLPIVLAFLFSVVRQALQGRTAPSPPEMRCRRAGLGMVLRLSGSGFLARGM